MLVLVGMGMGRDDLCPRALDWIEHAEVIAGGDRHLQAFPEHIGRKIRLRSDLTGFLTSIGEAAPRERTAVLASGDPLFYGIGNRIVRQMGRERVLVIPNITSVQALFARLGEPWEDVRVLSLHGAEERALESDLLREVSRHSRLAVFTDPKHSPGWIARKLRDAGIDDRLLMVGEDLGLPTESIGQFTLDEALGREFSPLNLVAIFSGKGQGKGNHETLANGLPVFGFPEEEFQHEAGLITKLEIRAVVLAHLRLVPGLTLWDLGAGSGSVAIEAARIAPLCHVFAVEKHEGRIQNLKANVRRFGSLDILAVHGGALEVMDSLPDPDRVFIGGSGGDLEAILTQVANRLRPGGRVVQTAVTLDTLERARSFWAGKPFGLSITQMQISRSVPVGRSVRFDALTPVFVITSWRLCGHRALESTTKSTKDTKMEFDETLDSDG